MAVRVKQLRVVGGGKTKRETTIFIQIDRDR